MPGWRGIIILALLALVGAGLAGWAWQNTRAPLMVAGQGEALLPALAEKLGEVARIEVTRGKDALVIRRNDKGEWVAGEAAWPVPAAQVRSVLMTLAEMKKVRPATALPERYRFIHVDDPNPESLATRLVLKDARGRVLADVILGKDAGEWLGGGRTAQFVRLAGARQSWLVEGHVRAPLRIADWADATVLKLPAKELAQVSIRRDGEELRLLAQEGAKGGKAADGKDEWAALPFRLAEELPGAKPHAPALQRLAYALEDLTFEDVRPAAFLAGSKPLATARVKTRKGLVLEWRVYHLSGKGEKDGWWLTGTVTEAGSDAQTAEKLKKRLNGRAFRVYDSVGESLSLRLEDVIRTEVKNAAGEGSGPEENATNAPGGASANGERE